MPRGMKVVAGATKLSAFAALRKCRPSSLTLLTRGANRGSGLPDCGPLWADGDLPRVSAETAATRSGSQPGRSAAKTRTSCIQGTAIS